MAYTGTIATEAEIALMAGENVDSTGDTEANRNLLMAQVEGYLSALIQYDIVTNWGSLNSVMKKIFSEYAARYCAVSLIAYNMSSVGTTFSSLIEPEDMIQIHIYRMEEIEKVLTEGKILKALGVA